MAQRYPHKFTGTSLANRVVMQLDVYAGIKDVVGVQKLADNETAGSVVAVREALRTAEVIRMVVRYKEGGVFKTSRILCDIDKAPSAVASLPGKAFSGGIITSASIPRRRRLG